MRRLEEKLSCCTGDEHLSRFVTRDNANFSNVGGGLDGIRELVSTWVEIIIQLPDSQIAQLVEHCTSIAEVKVRIPFRAESFFRPSS